MSKAILIDHPGGPEVLQWRDIDEPEPKAGEVIIRQLAVGLNYIDVYHRSGLYPMPSYPATIGVEGAGVILRVGPKCELGFKEGQRVCYAGGPVGAYSQYRAYPETYLAGIPDKLSNELAAGVMVKGLTAYYLLKRTFFADQYTTMLVHAAAGGVGLLLCQWGKLLGATVIGTVGSDEKAELVKHNGCDYAINYKKEDFVDRVSEITGGRGCNVVYDSVGADTFMRSLDCLMPFGMMVSFGQSSGKVPPVDLFELQKRGSLLLTRPSLSDFMRDRAEYIVGATELLHLVNDGKLKINVKQSYYLKDAKKAHMDLEARKTSGATIFFTEA